MQKETEDTTRGLAQGLEDLATQLVLMESPQSGARSTEELFESLARLETQARGAELEPMLALLDQVRRLCDPAARLDPAAWRESLKPLIDGLRDVCPAEESDPESASSTGLGEDTELLSDFVLEAREHLTSVEERLLVIEQAPGDMEAIHSIFRSFHTIKGLAGFLEFGSIQRLAHEVETVLDEARNERLAVDAAVIDVVLASKDLIFRWLDQLGPCLGGAPRPKLKGEEPLIERLEILLRGGGGTAFDEEAAGAAPAEPAFADLTFQPLPDSQEQVTEPAPAAEIQAPAFKKASAENAPAERERNSAAKQARSIKVDTGKLDFLVDMVGEMVIAQSLLRHDPDLVAVDKPSILRSLSQLTRVTDEVQKTAMALRMVPVRGLFQNMARLVRDLGRKSGKSVVLETEGDETELDRNIVEELADPLMHMVRNAVDHGIETAEQRTVSGKPPQAKVRLAARHQSGRIVIEVGDDGKGLDAERIFRKAVDRGLVDETAHLSEAEIQALIFQPGFSTSEQVTDVSGRGVGMDVVRKQILKLRGRIDIHSERGKGTTFLLKLPLTLAIIDSLVVVVGGERYILPIAAVREVLRPADGMISAIENRSEVALIRNRLVPVIRLYRRFGLTPRSVNPTDGVLIVVESDSKAFAILVDELAGKQEVVIKSLGEIFKHVQGVAGGAILGDGRVGLILDVDSVCGGTRDA